MKKSRVFSVTLFMLLASFVLSASAGDFQWSGVYRFEGYQISNSDLSNKKEKSYGLHHLILKPKIVAADGLNIHGRFDIFNSSAYPNSQMGQVWGSGVNDSLGATPTTTTRSSVGSETQAAESLEVTNLYVTLVQEFGSLIAGRVPLHFGLGLTHNSGKGLFDHWMDTRDLVGYKMVMGNLYLFPMYAKVSERDLDSNEDVTDMLIHLQYDNPETDMEMGFYYWKRNGNGWFNDMPLGATSGAVLGGAGALASGKIDLETMNFYAQKNSKTWRLGFEASIQSGRTGVQTSANKNVEMNGLGVAFEYEYRPQTSKFKYGFNAGYASGDDPETDDNFEGFVFDRNYDVAFLLFNQQLGQANIFRTGLVGGGPTGAGSDASTSLTAGTTEKADVEAISNVMYFSPYMEYKWSDRYNLLVSLTSGWLNQDPIIGADVDKSVGYELDISFNFQPNDRITWINGVGLLFPGTAFEADNNFDAGFAYGLISKAAISF